MDKFFEKSGVVANFALNDVVHFKPLSSEPEFLFDGNSYLRHELTLRDGRIVYAYCSIGRCSFLNFLRTKTGEIIDCIFEDKVFVINDKKYVKVKLQNNEYFVFLDLENLDVLSVSLGGKTMPIIGFNDKIPIKIGLKERFIEAVLPDGLFVYINIESGKLLRSKTLNGNDTEKVVTYIDWEAYKYDVVLREFCRFVCFSDGSRGYMGLVTFREKDDENLVNFAPRD